MTDGEAIQRFVRAAATLEPDLARWAAAAIWRGLPRSRRRGIRDEILREAAKLFPRSSTWKRAHRLAFLARQPGSRPGVSTAEGLVALSLAVYSPERRDRDLSVAQIYRILASSRIPPIEMQVAEVLSSDSMLGIIFQEEDNR
jgi:hypothetical protein